MPRTIKKLAPSIAAGALLAAPRTTFACAVCMGRVDDASVQGLNAAVVTLSAALLLVLGTIAGFAGYLARRSLKHPMAVPGTSGGVA